MADILLDLQINTGASAKELAQINKALKATREEIKENGDASGELTKRTLELSQEKRSLTKDINDEIKFNKALNGSQDQLIATQAILKKRYNALSDVQRDSTAEGKRLAEQLTKVNDKLKENDANVGDTRRNVGNYTESIVEAFKQLEKENKEIEDNIAILKKQTKEVQKGTSEHTAFTQELVKLEEELEDNNKALGKSEGAITQFSGALADTPFGGFIDGIKATGKAFLANPIALIVAGIVGALALLKESFTSTEQGQNEFNKALNLLKAGFDLLLRAIRPVAVFLADKVVKGFKAVGKAAVDAAELVASGAELLGLEGAAASIRRVTEAIERQAEASIALSNAQSELNRLQREQQKIQLEAQLEQERLRIARDTALSRSEELKLLGKTVEAQQEFNRAKRLNNQLGASFNKQLEEELRIANLALDVANKQIEVSGATTDNLELRTEAETNIVDIRERILGLSAEQQTVNDSIRRQEVANAQAIADAKIKEEQRVEAERKKIEEEKEIERVKKEEEAAKKEVERLAALKKAKEEEARINKEAEEQIAADKQTSVDKSIDALNDLAQLSDRQNKQQSAAAVAAQKATQLQTSLALGQAAANNISAISKQANLPFPANIAAIASTVASVTAALVSLKKLTTFEKGGILSGPSHAQGGIPFSVGGQLGFEAEGGEAIINKRSTKLFAPLLSAINSHKGFGRKFQDGGVVSAPISAPNISTAAGLSNIFNTDELASKIGDAVSENVQVVLPVESLNETQNNVNIVENTVTF